MKPNIRWQLLLAVLCLGLVLSLLSFEAQSGGLCMVRVPAAGGSLDEGIVGAPHYLNPLLSDANPVDQELVDLIFDGLTRYDEDGRLAPALAARWSVSDDGQTFRFELRPDVTWHDGRPVTATDVAFTFGLVQDEAFPGAPGLRTLWTPITITTEGESVVNFTLPEPYAPFLEATTRGILPAHLLAGVTAAELPDHPFNLAPVGTGPFQVDPTINWQRSGRLRLLPNPDDWRPLPQIEAITFRFYPDAAALLAGYRDGQIRAIDRVTPTMLPQVTELPGVRLFTSPAPRYTQLLFNLTAGGSTAVRTLGVRQALSYALDREQLVAAALNGQGVMLEGPYLPNSWAYNPVELTVWATEPISATRLLEANDWTLPEGESVRRRGDERLVLRLLFTDIPRHRALVEQLAAQWGAFGAVIDRFPVPATLLTAALAEREYDLALVDVAPPGDPDLYDFWSQEAIVRGQNYAGWNNRRASEALERARQIVPVEERRPYYNTFLRLYNQELPALTLYQHVYTYALSEAVQEADIGRIDGPRDRYQTLPNWFLLYREVAVSCPDGGAPTAVLP